MNNLEPKGILPTHMVRFWLRYNAILIQAF